eukprot:1149922-Pelagomonas_calceolata.AAC.2
MKQSGHGMKQSGSATKEGSEHGSGQKMEHHECMALAKQEAELHVTLWLAWLMGHVLESLEDTEAFGTREAYAAATADRTVAVEEACSEILLVSAGEGQSKRMQARQGYRQVLSVSKA